MDAHHPEKNVEVNVLIEGTFKSLDQRERVHTDQGAGESQLFFSQIRSNAWLNNAKHPTHDRRNGRLYAQ